MANLLEVRGLCKDYGDFALKNVSFTLPGGAIMVVSVAAGPDTS